MPLPVGLGRFPSVTKLDRKILAVSVFLYVVAVFLPGLAAHGPNPYGFHAYSGFECLVWGGATALGGSRYFLPWSANLFYLPALILWCLGRWGRVLASVLALGGLIFASFTFRIDSVIVNEAGLRAAVRPGLGAWFWIASMLVILVGPLVKRPAPPVLSATAPQSSGTRLNGR